MFNVTPEHTPQYILECAFQELQLAVTSSKHDFHLVSLSTHTKETLTSKTIVLRGFDEAKQSFVFYTDIRSDKVSNIKHTPNGCLLFYSPTLKLQLKFNILLKIEHQTQHTDDIYAALPEHSKTSYINQFAPGTPYPKGTKTIAIDEHAYNTGAYFACLHAKFDSLDLLALQQHEHIRILYDWDNSNEATATYIAA